MSETVRPYILPPPTFGWNTKDNIADMDPRYAVEAFNWFSDGATVDVRQGSSEYASGVGTGDGTGVFELALQSGTRKLAAFANSGHLYDCTAGGAATDLGAMGLTALGILGVNFRNKLFLKPNDSSIDVYYWDGGASVTAAAFSGPSSDDKAVFAPQVYKSRLYFVGNDASIWYGGLDAITGTLTQFDVQSVLTLGGKLLFVGGIQKTGDINQSLLTLISDRGEILIYSGSWPGDTAWRLVGHYYGPPPIGYNSFFYWGANLVIITWQGVVLLSEILRGGTDLVFLTDKINNQFVASINSTGLVSGCFYPKGNLLLINYLESANEFRQFVMNTITGSWWKWDYPIIIAGIWNDNLVACVNVSGSSGKVNKLVTTYADTFEGQTRTRTIALRPAYSTLGLPGKNKQITHLQPVISMSDSYALTMRADMDFEDVDASAADAAATEPESTSAYTRYRPTLNADGIGVYVSPRIDMSVTTKQMTLHATKVLFKEAGTVF